MKTTKQVQFLTSFRACLAPNGEAFLMGAVIEQSKYGVIHGNGTLPYPLKIVPSADASEAVLKRDAHKFVAQMARELNLFIAQCDMCEGSGKHRCDVTSACDTCGGTGRLSNAPSSDCVENLLRALNQLAELDNVNALPVA